MGEGEDTLPGSLRGRERARQRSSTTLALHSVRFEQACRDLGIPEEDDRRDVLRRALAVAYDDGVRSCEPHLKRLRASLDLAQAELDEARRRLEVLEAGELEVDGG